MSQRSNILVLILCLAVSGSAAGDAQINVDLNDGTIELTNASSSNLELAGYSILSDASSLENTNWLSIATSYDANDGGEVDPDDNWFFLANSDFEFSEATVGSATLTVGQTVNLGVGAFVPGRPTDLVFEFVNAATRQVEPGTVVYSGVTELMADFNDDGMVNGDDFLIWQSHFGVTAYADRSIGDANGDGAVTGDDFLVWQSEFGDVVSAGIGGNAAIPEPSTTALVCSLATILLACRRRDYELGRGRGIASRHG